jgi:hypothetical protein
VYKELGVPSVDAQHDYKHSVCIYKKDIYCEGFVGRSQKDKYTK